MHDKRARSWVTAIAVTLIAAIALAACGSSSTTGSKTSSSSAAASASSSRTKLAACLKQHGITLPSRPAGAKPPSGGAGGGGGYGGGAFGGGGAGAGGPGGANGAQSSKFRAAFKACGADFGGGGGRFGRSGAGGFKPTAAALSKFTACVDAHGYKLPKANTSGNGAIFPKSIESNKKFEAAAKACASDLRPSGGPGSGSSGSGSSD
jgi:hypothetical protein